MPSPPRGLPPPLRTRRRDRPSLSRQRSWGELARTSFGGRNGKAGRTGSRISPPQPPPATGTPYIAWGVLPQCPKPTGGSLPGAIPRQMKHPNSTVRYWGCSQACPQSGLRASASVLKWKGRPQPLHRPTLMPSKGPPQTAQVCTLSIASFTPEPASDQAAFPRYGAHTPIQACLPQDA